MIQDDLFSCHPEQSAKEPSLTRGFSPEDIQKSRGDALKKVIEFLEVEDVENQFKSRNKGHWSQEKFVVTWKSNWHGIPSEARLDLMDPFYTCYSGYKTARVSVSLFHEKMLEGHRSVYEGLVKTGLHLCGTRAEKKAFHDKYVPRFNAFVAAHNAALLKLKSQPDTAP